MSGVAVYDPSTVRSVSTHPRTSPPRDRDARRYARLTPQIAKRTTVVPLTPTASEAPRKTAAYGGKTDTAGPDAAVPANDRKARKKAKRTKKKTAKQKAAASARTAKPGKMAELYDDGKSDRKWYSRFWPLGERVKVKSLKDDYVPFMTEKTDKETIGQLPSRPKQLVEGGATASFPRASSIRVSRFPSWARSGSPDSGPTPSTARRSRHSTSGRTGAERETELANRLDLFINLQLTGTEKILLGLRPTDRNRPDRFTRYTFEGRDQGFNSNFSATPQTLFFEGDFGSLFPASGPGRRQADRLRLHRRPPAARVPGRHPDQRHHRRGRAHPQQYPLPRHVQFPGVGHVWLESA